MKLSVTVIAKVLACLILFIWLPQTAEAARRMLLGVYYSPVTPDVQAMEGWQGKKHAVVNIFTNWCDDTTEMNNFFTVQLFNIWDNENIPMITWKPSLGNDTQCPDISTPDDVEVQATDGTYDPYLHSWAEQLKTFLAGPNTVYGDDDDRRVYLRLAHEMNGDWYEWSAPKGDNSPADYISMWQHVKAILDGKDLDANHVQWVWSVNDTDYGGSNDYTAEQYYPGDDYVDWVAIDGYNRGGSSWKTPHEVFNGMADRLHDLTINDPKPLAITEVGSTSTNPAGIDGDFERKARWITTFFNQAVKHNDVKMVVWFNEDKEDIDNTGQTILNDWAVFGGAYGDTAYGIYSVYTSYRTAVATDHFVGSNVANLRLLTNAQFKGR